MRLSVHNSNHISIVVAGVLPLTDFGTQDMYDIKFNEHMTSTKVHLNGNTMTSFNKNKTGTLTVKLIPNSKEYLQLIALSEFVKTLYNFTFPITIINNNKNQLSYVLQRCSFQTYTEGKGRELKEGEVSFTFENYASPTLTTAMKDFL